MVPMSTAAPRGAKEALEPQRAAARGTDRAAGPGACLLEAVGVGHRDVRACDALDRRVKVVEGVRLHHLPGRQRLLLVKQLLSPRGVVRALSSFAGGARGDPGR